MVQYSEEYESMRKMYISRPCHECDLNYKGKCQLTPTFHMGDLDYLKALIDLDEEFTPVSIN